MNRTIVSHLVITIRRGWIHTRYVDNGWDWWPSQAKLLVSTWFNSEVFWPWMQ